MAAYYQRQRPLSKYVVHPHYADEQEAQIDYQVSNIMIFQRNFMLKINPVKFRAFTIDDLRSVSL